MYTIMRVKNITCSVFHFYAPVSESFPRGCGLPYKTEGDARRHFQKKPLRVIIFGVAPANFIP